MPKQTFGERTMRLDFNPSGNSAVDDMKAAYAEIIDMLNTMLADAVSGEAARLFSLAITETEGAAMWAVKAMTAPVEEPGKGE